VIIGIPRRRHAGNFLILFVCMLLIICLPALRAQQTPVPGEPDASVDHKRLELVEDLSESLANDLVELSLAIRGRNRERIADFIPPRLNSTPFPSRPQAAVAQFKWVMTRQWKPGARGREEESASFAGPNISAMRPVRREKFIRDLSRFLARFGEIEDVRCAVKEANFGDDARAGSGLRRFR
jgi:hypothetical protein